MVQAAAVPVTAPVRILRPRRIAETPLRWQQALERALENALDVYVEPIGGEAFVESASTPGTLYAVTRTSCTCPAGLAGDPVCQHRACYRAQTGELALPDATTVDCPDCCGCGVNDYGSFALPCDACGGISTRPAPRPRLIPVARPAKVAASPPSGITAGLRQ